MNENRVPVLEKFPPQYTQVMNFHHLWVWWIIALEKCTHPKSLKLFWWTRRSCVNQNTKTGKSTFVFLKVLPCLVSLECNAIIRLRMQQYNCYRYGREWSQNVLNKSNEPQEHRKLYPHLGENSHIHKPVGIHFCLCVISVQFRIIRQQLNL